MLYGNNCKYHYRFSVSILHGTMYVQSGTYILSIAICLSPGLV